MSTIKCILFDFFGTLVEYENCEDTFEEMYIPLTGLLNENEIQMFNKIWLSKYEENVERSVKTRDEFSMYGMVEEFANIFGQISKKTLHEVVDIFMGCWQQKVHICEDTLAVIPRLSKLYKIGIVSNTHYRDLVPNILNVSGLKEYFEVVILSVETKRRKPCKSIFQNAIDSFNMKPEECWFVGDNYDEDIVGAESAGMKAVQIYRGSREKHGNEEIKYICNLYELEALLAINRLRGESK